MNLLKLINIKGFLENIRMAVLLKLIQMVVKQISPELRDLVKTGLKQWKIKAAATDNPWDDLIVDLLIYIIGED